MKSFGRAFCTPDSNNTPACITLFDRLLRMYHAHDKELSY